MKRVARLFPFRRRVPLGEQLGDRYQQTDHQVVIPLHLHSGEDLLAPFECLFALDGTAPLVRNLSLDLVDYLYRRVAEVGDEALLLKVFLAQASTNQAIAALPPAELQDNLQRLIPEHFAYLATVKTENLKRLARDSCLLALLGLTALGSSIPVDALSFPDEASIPLHLLGQGITVFGWLTLWEALVNSLWTWQPIYRQLRMCQRLQQATVEIVILDPSNPVEVNPSSIMG